MAELDLDERKAGVAFQDLERQHHLQFRVQGSGFRVQGSGFRVQGAGFNVQGSGFRVQGSEFRVQSSGFCVLCSGFWVQSSTFRIQANERACKAILVNRPRAMGIVGETHVNVARQLSTVHPRRLTAFWSVVERP